MLGFLKKKKPPTNMLEALVCATYGRNPPPKSADLEHAILLAYEKLLFEQISLSAVRQQAVELFAGPMPYSTHDLAISTALAFFKKPENFGVLADCQIKARMQLLEWLKEGSVVMPLAAAFENVLYQRYKPV